MLHEDQIRELQQRMFNVERAKSLPFLINTGGGGSAEYYRCIVRSGLFIVDTQTAYFNVDVFELQTADQVATGERCYSYLNMYDDLETGDWAICSVDQKSRYLFIDAPCYRPFGDPSGPVNPSAS